MMISKSSCRCLVRLSGTAISTRWSWNRPSRDLFEQVDRALWTATRHNPVRILRRTPRDGLVALTKDPSFLRDFDAVLMELDRDTKDGQASYQQAYPDLCHHPIAYFSAEFGLHISLPIYSGGLGGSLGSHERGEAISASPFVAVGPVRAGLL